MSDELLAAENTVLFEDFALLPEVKQAVSELGYQAPTPVQAQSIPHLLEGRDVLGVAQTGTGKTAAFALPLFSAIDCSIKKPQLLVLAPTRELAIQVADAFKAYGKYLKGFSVVPVYGGADYRGQLRALERGAQVVVGTPGRVMDHIRRKSLKLETMQALVLDEADEMLRMGFIDDVEWVLEQMPPEHQTALFSATMPAPIKRITKNYLNDPAEVSIKVKTTTAETITQRYWQVKGHEKKTTLLHVLECEDFDAAIIFVRTKNATLEVSEALQRNGFRAEALNGDIAQNQREKTVNQLKKGHIDILVATDVAARGLDVERMSHVINYDVPFDTESYVHRIGRTGRAGREGQAILFVTGRERNMLGQIERATKQKIAKYTFPTVAEINQRKEQALMASLLAQLEKPQHDYDQVLALLQHSELSEAQLVQALLGMHLQGKPFYNDKAMPVMQEQRERKGKRESDEQREARRSRKKRGEFADIPMQRYRLTVGREHGVQKGDIVGAIANEADISSANMGKILLHGSESYIDLPEGMPKETFQKLQKVVVRGNPLNLEEAAADAGEFGGDDYADRPRKRRDVRKRRANGSRDGNRDNGRDNNRDGNRGGDNRGKSGGNGHRGKPKDGSSAPRRRKPKKS